ncbi:uncharacterized protein LOC113231695 isoform X2 [Hyposmocoma kahamanoa]|uniref:uncharacterized protein LOC113231695 isoform X2 n=1 Tax=Hyposmocoma kahamanoa TaxID=1477025 RepID=UPI000E6D9510|nr:uncharacterized protein LOC113231695 isoform X2 [Hyposmocoma kahamanoa]
MTIPPFPSQDLAKLVLGYLAEEQLMTAYDEFLEASPYLDAFRNEYDRIFMTSLKSILAEYRAVKIYVETCRPYALRRRLFGCTNLLEVVKFLIQNVDLNKISTQDTICNKSRGWAVNNTSVPAESTLQPEVSQTQISQLSSTNVDRSTANEQRNQCAVCNSMQLPICACKSRCTVQNVNITTNEVDSNLLESSVEATGLDDIPGSYTTTRKRHVRVLDKEPVSQCEPENDIIKQDSFGADCAEQNILTHQVSHERLPHAETLNNNIVVDPARECAQKIEEFDNILNVVCNKNNNNSESLTHNGVPGTFQDFATGVRDGENQTMQSSTSTNINIAPRLTGINKSVKGVTHIFLNIGNQGKNQLIDLNSTVSPGETSTPNIFRRLDSKPNEQRITILSNVKVDKANTNNANTPPVLKNATSTPSFPTCTITSEAQPLGPLVIDVSSNNEPVSSNDTIVNNQNGSTERNQQNDPKKAEMLVKTIDLKNASAPKDTEVENKSTPQVQPPLRKSSSTPRRTSHVRVLDFTTPRRILQENINEQGLDENGQPMEVVVSKSPSLQSFVESASKGDDLTNIHNEEKKIACNDSNTSGSSKENEGAGKVVLKKVVPVKTYNWDAGLRALVGTKDDVSKQKQKPVMNKQLTTTDKLAGEKEKNVSEKKKSRKNHVCNTKSKNKETEEPALKVEDTTTIPAKPNINIITSNDWNSLHDNDKNQNKSHNEKQTDTPEMERISLQNALGVKLNISDLLETPYKQAIYDIQMETPRFLGPDLPDVPLSDIKIMNIPTPRFLNTPKPSQVTPSSYSSRPTDYSSGGSYYKPDDQDYIPVDLEYPPISSLKDVSQVKTVQSVIEKQKEKQKSNGVKSRPVRKCTKNVSYYNSPIVNKTKEDEKSEVASSCSDSISANSPNNNKVTNLDHKTKNVRTKTRTKSETKRKSNTARKRKTPVKKDTPKSFMKIKPRKPTPTKESLSGRYKTKTPDSLTRKRVGKEKIIGATPLIATAPTKSRRKSSTPRKLHCTKTFNSESSGHNSPEIASASKESRTRESSVSVIQDSDTEQLRLRWSDDGSQDAKPKDQLANNSTNESEDITKIKEYIETTETVYSRSECNLHIDLVKRGFDIETARIIERDLLDTPPVPSPVGVLTQKYTSQENTSASVIEIAESTTTTTKFHTAEDNEETEIEFSVSECNEESKNYFTCVHDDTETVLKTELPKLKDKFSMEVCIDDDVTVRLRAAPFTVLLEQEPVEAEILEDIYKETEIAVNSISNIDRLYTPLKDPVKAQCYEIFDSTLTSLDTPLKAASPKRKECDAEIILEVEKVEVKSEKSEMKKRKRLHSSEVSEESANENKRSKPDTQYLLTTTNIQNIDIETVLSKLHGP